MNRALTLLAASACASIAVSAACFAAETAIFSFRLAKSGDTGRVQLSMGHREDINQSESWSQSVALAELHGLAAPQLAARTAAPIRFALVRPAGSLNCSGTARSYDGHGTCAFSANATFSAMLARRGIGQPNLDQSYKLAMSDFRPEVLDALATAKYPRPTLDEAVALAIFKIGPADVRGLADANYRLRSIADLVGFKIHRVTPDFIRGFAGLGYGNLPADRLVQLRIFNVTPDDVRALQAQGIARPTPDELVRLRIAGFGPKRRRK